MTRTITANGNYPVNGISPGREFSIATSGTFGSATVKAQYATALPVAATLTLDDDEGDPAIVLTASDAGAQGNDIKVEIVAPSDPDALLGVAQDGRTFEISLATSKGDAASVAIGDGTNGTVTVSAGVVGTAGNAFDIEVVQSTAIDAPMTAILSGANARPRIVVTLGADGEGDPDDAKNTATLVAAAITALTGFTATASGTGEDVLTAEAVKAFTGGGDNAVPITTVADLLSFFKGDIFLRHFTAALAEDADPDEQIALLAETSLSGGTDGTFVDFPGDNEISFTAAGAKISTNPGVLPAININVADATGTTSIVTIVNELPK